MQKLSMLPSPTLSYLIGCYLSDGCVSEYKGQCQFILVTTDEPYMESVRAAWALMGRKPYVRYTEPKPRPTSFGRVLKPEWRVVVGCKDFHEWIVSHTGEQLLDLGMISPWRMLCGLYEGDGSIFWKRGRKKTSNKRLALTVVFNTDQEVIGRVRVWLEAQGYHPCVYTKSAGRNLPISEIRLGRQHEIQSFLKMASPCIKVLPRPHVNTEPSL